MRGLTDKGDGGGKDDSVGCRAGSGRNGAIRTSAAASGTAMAGLAAVVLLCVSCSTGGTGTRDEGPAGTQPVAQATKSGAVPAGTEPPVRRVDAVALVQRDPHVSPVIKKDLHTCSSSEYPVDTSYGTLTDGPAADVVVNVLSCGDSVGIGTYVYRQRVDGAYENVFMTEVPAVYGTIDRGELVVTTQVYGSKDAVAYPSGEDVVTYRWANSRFTEHDRVHNDFNRAVDSGEGNPPGPPAPTTNN